MFTKLKKMALSWAMPQGWRAVPKAMTYDQKKAAKKAMSAYIRTIPADEREKMPKTPTGGCKIGTELKFQLRYHAAVKAAPDPYQ